MKRLAVRSVAIEAVLTGKVQERKGRVSAIHKIRLRNLRTPAELERDLRRNMNAISDGRRTILRACRKAFKDFDMLALWQVAQAEVELQK